MRESKPHWKNNQKSTGIIDTLQTPFGKLFTSVHEAVDPNVAGSVVDEMNKAAVALRLTPLLDQ